MSAAHQGLLLANPTLLPHTILFDLLVFIFYYRMIRYCNMIQRKTALASYRRSHRFKSSVPHEERRALREIKEDLAKLTETVNEQFKSVNEQFKSVDKKFNEQFKSMDEKFSEKFNEKFKVVDRRVMTVGFGLGGLMIALFGATLASLQAFSNGFDAKIDGQDAKIDGQNAMINGQNAMMASHVKKNAWW